MQDRYVGDIGDFGKYGLLRELFGCPEEPESGCGLRLGVAWYLSPDESEKTDGKFIDYLWKPKTKDKKLRDCDPMLYKELYRIVLERNRRRILEVQDSGILLKDTLYYEQCLSYPDREPQSSRRLRREAWLNGALEATKTADVVFVDPDNGISEKPIQFRKHGPKCVFMEDLSQFYERGQSLVIYHHLGRQGAAIEQINRVAGRLKECLSLPCLPRALW